MHVKAVKYRDTYLAPGSDALALYEKKEFKMLDQHLKLLDANEKALLGRYKRKDDANAPTTE